MATLDAMPVLEPPSALMMICVNELSDNLTEEEIAAAISQMRKGRAPGLDRILTEMLKLGGAESVCWLKIIADGIWRTEMVPSDWMKQMLIPIHKKGCRTTCDNYCGIALLSIPSKIFSRAILNRLKPYAEFFLRENQCGFRQDRGCADQLFSLQVLMEKAREFHKQIYICFIDLRKAYDSVNRISLWTVLQRPYSIPTKLISIICALHEHSVAAIRCYGKTSDEFAFTSGVCQDCVLAPTLFNLYFDVVIRMALENGQPKGRGVRVAYIHSAKLVGNCRKLQHEAIISDLEYADDMALVAESWDDLKSMLDNVSMQCRDLGLIFSCSKIKTLAVLPSDLYPKPVPIDLFPDDDPVEVVSIFQYLGSIVQDNCGTAIEMDSIICKAYKAFRSLCRILWYQRKIKTCTKLRIFNAIVLPTLPFDMESLVLHEPSGYCDALPQDHPLSVHKGEETTHHHQENG